MLQNVVIPTARPPATTAKGFIRPASRSASRHAISSVTEAGTDVYQA